MILLIPYPHGPIRQINFHPWSMRFDFRRRHETEKSTVLRSPLPSIAKEVEESVKVVTLKDSTGPTSSNQESLYHVIEDEDGYLTYPVKDREGITRYSKTPTTYNNVQRFITDEECDNVNNAYLDVIKWNDILFLFLVVCVYILSVLDIWVFIIQCVLRRSQCYYSFEFIKAIFGLDLSDMIDFRCICSYMYNVFVAVAYINFFYLIILLMLLVPYYWIANQLKCLYLKNYVHAIFTLGIGRDFAYIEGTQRLVAKILHKFAIFPLHWANEFINKIILFFCKHFSFRQ